MGDLKSHDGLVLCELGIFCIVVLLRHEVTQLDAAGAMAVGARFAVFFQKLSCLGCSVYELFHGPKLHVIRVRSINPHFTFISYINMRFIHRGYV